MRRLKIRKPCISNNNVFISSSLDVKTEFLVKGIVEITSIGDLNIVISALNKIKERWKKIRKNNG